MDQKKTIVIDNPSVLKNYTHPIGGKIIKSVTDKSDFLGTIYIII